MDKIKFRVDDKEGHDVTDKNDWYIDVDGNLYFETNDWSEKRPCDGFLNSPYSVEDINKQAVAWLHTDKFNILAGTTYEDFIKIIQRHDGEIYTLKEKDKWR